jgi:hypothetical protein
VGIFGILALAAVATFIAAVTGRARRSRRAFADRTAEAVHITTTRAWRSVAGLAVALPCGAWLVVAGLPALLGGEFMAVSCVVLFAVIGLAIFVMPRTTIVSHQGIALELGAVSWVNVAAVGRSRRRVTVMTRASGWFASIYRFRVSEANWLRIQPYIPGDVEVMDGRESVACIPGFTRV